MAISLKHKFQVVREDGADPTVVQPSDWNDEHDISMASGRVLGRISTGEGPVEELTQAALRTFLGLGSAAYAATSAFLSSANGLLKANNLSDVANTTTARANIGANNASNLTTGTVADARLPAASRAAGIASAISSALVGYLRTNEKAADSNLLDGLDSSYFRNASNLNSGEVPEARLPQVLRNTISPSKNGIGCYGFFCKISGGRADPGDDTAGSNLRWSPSWPAGGDGGTPNGTWKCMGFSRFGQGIDDDSTSLFVRVA